MQPASERGSPKLRVPVWRCRRRGHLRARQSPRPARPPARAVGSMPQAAAWGPIAPSDRRLRPRNILRRRPNAAAVTRLHTSADRAHGSGSVRGIRRTTEEVTFGGGTKAAGATSNRIFASQRQPASTASRPYALAPVGNNAFGDFTLEHQNHPVYQGGHGSITSQRTSKAVAML